MTKGTHGVDAVAEFLLAVFGDADQGILITGRISGHRGSRNIDKQEYWDWPAHQSELSHWARRHDGEDLYFSPMLYGRRSRTKEAVIYTPVVWADADLAKPESYALTPSITLETSPNRYQAFWALDEPVSPEWAERISRAITYSKRGAGSDIGGWALTKYMRLPGAYNTKPEVLQRNDGQPWQVTVDYDGAIYSPSELELKFGAVSIPSTLGVSTVLPVDLPERAYVLAKLPSDVNVERALTVAPTNSWSETLWWLQCELIRKGLTPPEVFVVVNGCACDKYQRDGRPEQHLWEEILRAEKATLVHGTALEDVERIEVVEPPVTLLTEHERANIPRTFVDDYVEWAASRTNAAIGYQEAGGFTVLSTVLADFAHAVPKFGNLGLNMWFLLVGVTTRTYKTTAKNLMLQVLRPIQNDTYEYDIGSDASPEGLLTELTTHPKRSVLFHRDEAHGMLAGAGGTKSYLSGFTETLTELYDGWARGRLRSTGRDKKVMATPINFNMFLLGVPDKLGRTLTREDFESGFMPRFIFAIGQPDRTVSNRLEQANVDGKERADDGLLEIQNKVLRMRAYWERETEPGETIAIRFTDDAWGRFNEFIDELDRLAEATDLPNVMAAGVSRLNKTVIKAATLLAMADKKSEVTMPYLLAAIGYAERWYSMLVSMTRIVGKSEFSGQVEDLVNYIQGKGGSVRTSAARRAFAQVEPKRWNDMLTAAIDQQLIASTKDQHGAKLVSL